MVADCEAASFDVVIDDARVGFVAFSEGATVNGCNPAITNCADPTPVVRTTWGRIKSAYGE